MNGHEEARVLAAEIEKHMELLEDLHSELTAALEEDIRLLGKTKRSAAMVASIIESYCTCAETVFLRISQFFENSLAAERWHKDLLDKMTLQIKDLRPRVISDKVHNDMAELLKFRHFKRYYFNLAYDWERLDAVVSRAVRVHNPLLEDLSGFLGFLNSLYGS